MRQKVGIVVLTYNSLSKIGEDTFRKILSRILGIDYENCKIIFVDNNSKDSTPEFISRFISSMRSQEHLKCDAEVLKLDRNYGWSGGNNRAAVLLKDTKYLLFLNDDVIVEPDIVSKLVDIMEKNPILVLLSQSL